MLHDEAATADKQERLLDLAKLKLEIELSETYSTPRSYGWLGEHQDEAAELAALLHEAAPKLSLASLRAPFTGSRPLPKARSYEVSDIIKDRLRAAEPMPTGPGQVPWSRLCASISSELLKFDESADAVAAAAAAARAASPASLAAAAAPGGDMLEINSGGRVFFCLFDAAFPSPSHTPHSSVRNSPERDLDRYMRRAAGNGGVAGPAGPAEGMDGQQDGHGDEAADRQGHEEGVNEEVWRQLAREPSLLSRGVGGSPYLPATGLAAVQEEGTEQEGLNGNGSASIDGSYAAQRQQQLQELQEAAVAGQAAVQPSSSSCSTSSCGSSSSGGSAGGSPCSWGSSSQRGGSSQHSLSSALPRSKLSFSFASPGAAGAAGSSGGTAGTAGEVPPTPRRLRRSGGSGLPSQQACLVLKFVSSRLLCQSEQFASELTCHVGLCAPDSRILRSKGTTEGEWQEAFAAAAALKDRFPDLYEEMGRNSCFLVMEFVPGGCLFKSRQAFRSPHLQQTAQDLGRLFTLDMLLGNPDRLRCEELAWRGNTENILYASAGRWAGRAVAIDAVVQRRPPGGHQSLEDRSCERLTELALNDAGVAGCLLRQAMQPAETVTAPAISTAPAEGTADHGSSGGSKEADGGTDELAVLPATAAAFQEGLKAALDAAVSIKGLLEMMFEVVTEWIEGFILDIEEAEGGPGGGSSSSGAAGTAGGGGGGGGGQQAQQHMLTPRPAGQSSRRASAAGASASPLLQATAQTMRIRQISHEAQHNDSVGEKVAHWKGVFREKGEELRAAVEEWQQKRGTPAGAQRLTTAFLDGTHPTVDVYELKVRLEHMLQRLRVLQQASLTGRPSRLMPRLFLSGAVEASSHHLLRHLGITHVLNATEDLLLPEESLGFVTLRCPLADLEEEELGPFLPDAAAFIDEGLAKGGGVLVHCHAGKSRSVSLVLAWLMMRRSWPLNRALDFLRRMRPEAQPNAGYLAALLKLEEELFGRQTVKMKKTKPEPRVCPECGDRVGLSADSVRVHIRFKHPASALARSMQGSQEGLSVGVGSGGSWADVGSPRSPHSPQGLIGPAPASSPRSTAVNGGTGSSSRGGSLLSPRAAQAGAAVQEGSHVEPSGAHLQPGQQQEQGQEQQFVQQAEQGHQRQQQGEAVEDVEQLLARQQQQQQVQQAVHWQQGQQHGQHGAVSLNHHWSPNPLVGASTLAPLLTSSGSGGWRTAEPMAAAAGGQQGSEVGSPVSMAAALRGELGSVQLCAGDAEEEEEFLQSSTASTPHQVMEAFTP